MTRSYWWPAACALALTLGGAAHAQDRSPCCKDVAKSAPCCCEQPACCGPNCCTASCSAASSCGECLGAVAGALTGCAVPAATCPISGTTAVKVPEPSCPKPACSAPKYGGSPWTNWSDCYSVGFVSSGTTSPTAASTRKADPSPPAPFFLVLPGLPSTAFPWGAGLVTVPPSTGPGGGMLSGYPVSPMLTPPGGGPAVPCLTGGPAPVLPPSSRGIPPAPSGTEIKQVLHKGFPYSPTPIPPASAEKAYVLELKLVEVRPGKPDSSLACPRLTVQGDKSAVVSIGDCLCLASGSVQDLVTRSGCTNPECQVRLGMQFQVKVSERDKDQVRVDLAVQRNEVETASKQGIVVLGNTLRAAQRVKFGEAAKVVLDRNDQGSARTWVEFKVTEARD